MKKNNLVHLLVALIGVLGALYGSYRVWMLYEQKQVLGTELLWTELLAWGAFLALTWNRWTPLPNNSAVLGASILSGVLLCLGFMKVATFPLLFVAFVPLLWAEHQLASQREGTDTWAMMRLSFNTFFIWNLLSTWWIQNSSLPGGLVGNVLNTIFMCLPLLLYHTTKHHMGQRGASLGLIAYWMTFEIGHLNWDLSWPWLTLGNGFAQVPALVQWYEYTGVFGGTLWILWANVMIANRSFGETRQQFQGQPRAWLAPAALMLLPVGASLILYTWHQPETGNPVEVVAVQPNYEPHYQKFSTPQHEQLQHFLELSRDKLTENTAYLVFPETSFRGITAAKVGQAPVIQQLQAFVQEYPELQLVTGISARNIFQDNEPHPPNAFIYCNPDKTQCQYIDAHNAAIQLSANQTDIPYYQKSKLVPGAESMPFIGGLEVFRNLILDLGGMPGVGLGTQAEREVFESNRGTVAPLICYESVYGDYVKDYVRAGAQAHFVITNDGWWGNTLGHRQHWYLSTLRAIETRRYVVRSANTGITCFIDSRGNTYKASRYDEPVALRDTIYLRTERTFYSQYGDLIGRVSILVSIWLLVSMVANRLRRPKDEDFPPMT